MSESKFHVALSFAGEDREYVEQVAKELKEHDTSLFYDKFDEVSLWGKDLYTYLREIYQNKAYFTVIFISEHYKNRRWTTHERESAQARAFSENREYILPARFDDTEIPGVLPTTGYIRLDDKSPKELASLIIEKLKQSGIVLESDSLFSFSEDALADVDFNIHGKEPIHEIIRQLKTYNWHTQNPAIKRLSKIDLTGLSNDQAFILGRNIYQCACGGVNNAVDFIDTLRQSLSSFAPNTAQCILAGILYEIYFNSEGVFRGLRIKGARISDVFKIQTVKKYSNCIRFIQKELEPYKDQLAVVPNNPPINIELEIITARKSPHKLRKLIFADKDLILPTDELDEEISNKMWRLSFGAFSLETLASNIAEACFIPANQLVLSINVEIDDGDPFVLPKDKSIRCPFGCVVT